MRNYRIKRPLKYRAVGWLGLLLFAPGYFIPWAEGAGVAFTLVTVFVLLSLYAVIEGLNTVEISPETIIQKKLFGSYGIGWDEIETIQYSLTGDWVTFETMILQGGCKRLSIPGPRDWAGEQSADARRWFYSEVRERGLDIKESAKAAFKFSRNVRLL